jgi:hypothetical protein
MAKKKPRKIGTGSVHSLKILFVVCRLRACDRVDCNYHLLNDGSVCDANIILC